MDRNYGTRNPISFWSSLSGCKWIQEIGDIYTLQENSKHRSGVETKGSEAAQLVNFKSAALRMSWVAPAWGIYTDGKWFKPLFVQNLHSHFFHSLSHPQQALIQYTTATSQSGWSLTPLSSETHYFKQLHLFDCSVTGKHKTICKKRYLPSSTYTSSQT